MPMQVRKNHQGRFAGFQAGKGLGFGPEGGETPSARFSGARNGCYVQSARLAVIDQKRPPHGRPLPARPFATILYFYSSAVMYTPLLVFALVILYWLRCCCASAAI